MKDNNISFTNIPLQNLRNILFDVDTSADHTNRNIIPTPLEYKQAYKYKTLSKNELLNIILELKLLREQYIEKSEIGRIYVNFCKNMQHDEYIDIIEKLRKMTTK